MFKVADALTCEWVSRETKEGLRRETSAAVLRDVGVFLWLPSTRLVRAPPRFSRHHRTARAALLLLRRRAASVQWGVSLSLRTQGSQPGDVAG